MTTFWILAAGMVLVALLFVMLPLLRQRPVTDIDQDQLNTEVIKEQLKELQADLDAGKLDQASYTAARTDLEGELLNQLEADRSNVPVKPRSGRWAMGLFGLLIPVLAFMLYLQLGTVDFDQRQDMAAAPATNDGEHPLAAMVVQLEQRMREEPDQLEGWLLLARSYAALNQYGNALNAYNEARRLVGDQPELLVDTADMLVMANGGRFTDEVGALLERALAAQPENAKGWWLKGHWKYRNNEIREAIDSWKKAAALLPPDSQNSIAINQQIRQAQNALGMTGSEAVATADDKAAQTPGAAVEVKVTLDPALSKQVNPADTVFVFARAAQGPRMPLAIVRKQVADLPLSVTLDDSLAMSPAMVLSNFDEVAVGARISKSGNAMPQSGDLQGISGPVQVQPGKAVEITIDQVIP